MSSTSDTLHALIQEIDAATERFIGFPAALDYDYSELEPLFHRFLNNIGDPQVSPWHGLTSKAMEREVLDFFAELFRAPAEKWWGYVTNGSTECNLYALYVARQRFPKGIVYYSSDAHYSIPKNIHILGCASVKIASQPSGEIDYDDLSSQLARHPNTPAIIVATVGTTMTEARDNLTRIKTVLDAQNIADHHIHVDAALAGPYAALLEPRWPFDFEDGADSVGVSGHKFLGSPMPCGVILVRKEYKELLDGEANYTGAPDTTISGSRNGHTPLMMWYGLRKYGKEGLRRRAQQGLELAGYTHQQLDAIKWKAWRNPSALTVMLESPSEPLIRKWQLATADGWSHVICMPGVTKQRIDEFIGDLRATQHI